MANGWAPGLAECVLFTNFRAGRSGIINSARLSLKDFADQLGFTNCSNGRQRKLLVMRLSGRRGPQET